MEIFLLLVLIWFFFSRAAKKRRKLERRIAKVEDEQARYDLKMISLPELQGDGSYSQAVEIGFMDRVGLDNHARWLLREHPGENEIWVMLRDQSDVILGPKEVVVEAGKVRWGTIPASQTDEFIQELKAFGGEAKCAAKVSFTSLGAISELWLDVVRPLRAKS